MQWRYLFDEKTLDKGIEYYENGMIESFELEKDHIYANVVGMDEYEVEINVGKKECSEMDMYCSCADARERNCCKHMAAVLYMWEEECRELEYHSESIENLYNKSTIEQRDAFLKNVLKKNETLALRFKTQLKTTFSAKDLLMYKQRLSKIIRKYTGNSGYVYYRDVDAFVDKISKYIDDVIMPILHTHCYDEAFTIYENMLSELEEVELDDEYESIFDLEMDCCGVFEIMFENADFSLQSRMISWCHKYANGWIGNMKDSLLDNLE